MNKGKLYIAPFLLLACSLAIGQSTPTARPVEQMPPERIPSPVVQPDGTVTFTLRAPNATAVTLSGDYPIQPDYASRKPVAMMKDEKGVWSATVGPLPPEMYSYSFAVDGTRTLDPTNQHSSRGSSWFLIPGPVSSNYLINDVPHGSVSEVWYPAPTLKLERKRMIVYTPPGYDGGKDRYPVLVLLHGGGMEETAWLGMRAPQIMDNLIAQGKAVPMIVVMPNGYVDQPLSNTDAAVPKRVVLRPNDPGGVFLDDPRVPNSIAQDIIPYLDRYYRTKPERQYRAVAGLSMGGAQAFTTALTHLDTFAWAGLFSPAMTGFHGVLIDVPMPADAAKRRGPEVGQSIDGAKFAADFPMLGPQLNDKLHLYYAIGEVDGGLLEASHVVKKVLDEKGVKYTWVELPDYGHEASFWRLQLQSFSAQVFRPMK